MSYRARIEQDRLAMMDKCDIFPRLAGNDGAAALAVINTGKIDQLAVSMVVIRYFTLALLLPLIPAIG
jgi:hypothetical protein